MKILHIAPISSNANGINSVVQSLSKSQQDIGNEVTIWRALKNGDKNYRFIGDIVDWHEEIESIKPDIVIFHSVYLWTYLKIGFFLTAKKIPYLIQLHGALSKENYCKGYVKKYIANTLFFKTFIRKASSIIYLNDNEFHNSVVPRWNPSHIIIPNGCDITNISRINPPNSKYPIRFLFIGRIDINHKGLDILIDAIKIINTSDRSAEFKFEFYGDGNKKDLDKFQNLLLGLESIAKFNGPIYGMQKTQKLQSSDIFIHTSRYEGMPMAVLEALACGLPCLLTPGTNMSKLVVDSNCGWETDPTPKAIASAILRIERILRYEQDRLSKNAIELASIFSWDEIAKESIRMYSDIIK